MGEVASKEAAVFLCSDVCSTNSEAATMDPRFKSEGSLPGRAPGSLDFPPRQPAWGEGSRYQPSNRGTTPDTPGDRASRTTGVPFLSTEGANGRSPSAHAQTLPEMQERLDALYHQQQQILVQHKQHQEQTRQREEREMEAWQEGRLSSAADDRLRAQEQVNALRGLQAQQEEILRHHQAQQRQQAPSPQREHSQDESHPVREKLRCTAGTAQLIKLAEAGDAAGIRRLLAESLRHDEPGVAWDVDVDCQDTHGNTPLHVSAWKGSKESCALLLQHGAKTVPNHNGQQASDVAMLLGHAACAALLRTHETARRAFPDPIVRAGLVQQWGPVRGGEWRDSFIAIAGGCVHTFESFDEFAYGPPTSTDHALKLTGGSVEEGGEGGGLFLFSVHDREDKRRLWLASPSHQERAVWVHKLKWALQFHW